MRSLPLLITSIGVIVGIIIMNVGIMYIITVTMIIIIVVITTIIVTCSYYDHYHYT